MKVELDSNGKLEILPETGVESYALSKWYDDWMNNNKNVVLSIQSKEIIIEDVL